MDTKEIFSKRLLELRESRELSRQTAADGLQISRASLEYYEKGLRLPDICVLDKIADFYGVSADYLLGRTSVKSMDIEMKAVCDYTGLTENSVMEIRTVLNKNDPYPSVLFEGIVKDIIQLINTLIGEQNET